MAEAMSEGILDVVKQLPEEASVPEERPAPLLPGQEWANALTHGVAAVAALLVGVALISDAVTRDWFLAFACLAYVGSATGTFTSSTLSHAIHQQPWLNTFRAWDQAMIYLMIAGTYTPIAVRFAPQPVLIPMLTTMWLAAWAGFFAKVFLRHRINGIGTASYLLLGWLPAIPLAGHVPGDMVSAMLLGGVLYTVGVGFLLSDRKVPYFHAVWHLFVMAAATVHFLAIQAYVVAEF